MSGLWKKCAGVAFAVAVGSAAAWRRPRPSPSASTSPTPHARSFTPPKSCPSPPGPLTVVYPKWIPGEHGPTGPIENMAGFFITANGQPIEWERDKVDMFAYHLTVPQGVTRLEMKIDFLATASPSGFSAGASTSENLALLSWNTLLVYPDGRRRQRRDVHSFHHHPRWMEVRHRARPQRQLGPAHHLQNRKPRAIRRLARPRWPLLPRDSARPRDHA